MCPLQVQSCTNQVREGVWNSPGGVRQQEGEFSVLCVAEVIYHIGSTTQTGANEVVCSVSLWKGEATSKKSSCEAFWSPESSWWDVNTTVSVSVMHGNCAGGQYRVPIKQDLREILNTETEHKVLFGPSQQRGNDGICLSPAFPGGCC